MAQNCTDAYATCLAAAAPSPPPSNNSSLLNSYLTLANSTAMYTLWAGYTATFVFFSLLFYYNRQVQPIKSRSPSMVLSSALGGWLLATNYTMANYVTGMHQWPCPFTNWTLWLGFSLFLLPYPIRALNLMLMFHRNVNKVRDHKVIVATEKLKMNKVVRKTHAKLVSGNPSFRGPAQLIPEDEEETIDQVVLQTVSSNKWHSLKRLESYLPHVFTALIAGCILIGLVRQFAPELGLGPECVGCIVTPNSSAVLTAVVLIVLVTQIVSVLLLQQQQIRDQYFIAGELKFISVVWFCFLIPVCALALNGLSCSYDYGSTHAVECQSSFPTFTDFCYQNFVVQHWLIIVCAVVTFILTVMAPVVASVRKGRKRLRNEQPKNVFPKFKALETLQDCLRDEGASFAFQEFCVQSFCVELVLFWRDAEQYRYLMETQALEMRIRALDVYIKYLDASGSLFIEVPEDIQDKLDAILAEPAARYHEEGENFDFSVLESITGDIFIPAQEEIFRQMDEEVFSQFKESDAAKELFKRYQLLTATAITFQQQTRV
ncbi:hypothetical protein BASA81_003037 [Batrachochytrium salamandrivorans]|nr:hypothetical protein BASA81_003037 [Batrachochytrium salamandrivorans]